MRRTPDSAGIAPCDFASVCGSRRAYLVWKGVNTQMAVDYTIEPSTAKVDQVSELRALTQASTATIFTDYRGLSVAELTDLRKKLRAADGEFRVVKNTLFRLAADGQMPVADMDAFLSGPTAIGFAKGDPVATAKVLVDFVQSHKEISVKAGVMNGLVLNAAQVDALSKTPPREVLISQMLGSLQAPISGFVGTLSGIISNFVFTLQAIADKQGEAAA
jgi:large subunit ribosomal protein L10